MTSINIHKIIERIDWALENETAFDTPLMQECKTEPQRLPGGNEQAGKLREALEKIATGKDKNGHTVDFFQDIASEALTSAKEAWPERMDGGVIHWKRYPDEEPEKGIRILAIVVSGGIGQFFFEHYRDQMEGAEFYWCNESNLIATIPALKTSTASGE